MAPTIELDAKLVNPAYLEHYGNNRRYQIYYGGSSSGKSYFLASRAAIDCLCGRNYLVARKVARTLRGSCWNEIIKAISDMQLTRMFQINKNDMAITSTRNGCQIVFAGLDDVEKIKSITPAKGVFTDIWLEEATEAAYGDYKQLDKRLRGLSKHAKRFTLSFNPVYKAHWLYGEFFGIWDEAKNYAESGNVTILKTTHRDNLFLAQEDHDALENEKDEYYRNVYTLSNWGTLGDAVFTNWRVEDLSEYQNIDGRLYFGLDFGFTNDPTAAVKARYEPAKKRVLILDELYGRGWVNADIAEKLKVFAGRHPVTCDAAEPKSIEELRRLGVNATASRKGRDSVMHGIQWLKGCEIVVDRRCQNAINELTLYQWRKDKDGNSLNQPQDDNNHLIDSLRYALGEQMEMRRIGTMSKMALGL